MQRLIISYSAGLASPCLGEQQQTDKQFYLQVWVGLHFIEPYIRYITIYHGNSKNGAHISHLVCGVIGKGIIGVMHIPSVHPVIDIH